jgi:hypothetical protein
MRANEFVKEGIMDTIKGAAKELTRDSLQRKIKQAWENTFWPKYVEPALNRIQINGKPFRRMVLGEPRVIENKRSQNAILKQYTVDIVFPIDPEQWAGDEIQYLGGQLQDIEAGDWNPKVHGLGLVGFDQPMKSFQYTRGETPDLVIPVRITSLEINRGLVGENNDGRDSEPEDVDDDGMTMADRARRDGRGGDDEDQPETAAQRRRRSLQATRDFNRGRRSDQMRESGVSEGLPQTLRKIVPGYAKREIDRKMDAGKFGKTDADKDANFYRYKKIQDKIKGQGVGEGAKWRQHPGAYDVDDEGNKTPRDPNSPKFGYDPLQRRADTAGDAKTARGRASALKTSLRMARGNKGVQEGPANNDFYAGLYAELVGDVSNHSVTDIVNTKNSIKRALESGRLNIADVKTEIRQLEAELKKQGVEESKGEGPWHISPSGVKTNMPPTDDDYDINYGKEGLVAQDRRSRGVDVRTGSRRVKKD